MSGQESRTRACGIPSEAASTEIVRPGRWSLVQNSKTSVPASYSAMAPKVSSGVEA